MDTWTLQLEQVPRTEAGFLLRGDDWHEDLAVALAASQSLILSDAHWQIIRFIRDYHAQYRQLPNARVFVKALQKALGHEIGNNLYLHQLFPGGPLRQACLIAGLPKPPGCL